jgi:hypothetical protein
MTCCWQQRLAGTCRKVALAITHASRLTHTLSRRSNYFFDFLLFFLAVFLAAFFFLAMP